MTYRVLEFEDSEDLTPEIIRQWGYDEHLLFSEQDEEVYLHDARFVPIMIELASDVNCPKQTIIGYILNDYSQSVLRYHFKEDAEMVAKALNSSPWANSPYIAKLRNWYLPLYTRLVEPQAVTADEADSIVQRLVCGVNNSDEVMRTGRIQEDYSEFVSGSEFQKYTYVNEHTGDWKFGFRTPWITPELPRELATPLGAFHLEAPYSLPRWLLVSQVFSMAILGINLMSQQKVIPLEIVSRDFAQVAGVYSSFLVPIILVMWTDDVPARIRMSFLMIGFTLSCFSLLLTVLPT